MFEKFNFSPKQIQQYYKSSLRDLKIALDSNISEVSFRFCYDAILKLAISICAQNGLRLKARQGHHIELIKKLSEYFKDKNIEIFGNEMRSKRNFDLYRGGTFISDKETKEYLKWAEELFQKAHSYLNKTQQKLF